MTGYELKVPGKLLSSLLGEKEAERVAYRNGYVPAELYTRVGELTLRVPQRQNRGFSTEIFAR